MTRTSELTVKLLDGALSDAECAELEALVAADPTAEVEYFALLDLEAELRAARTDFDLTGVTLAQIRDVLAERTAGAVMDQIERAPAPAWAARPTPAPRRRRWATVGALAACAAALSLALWLGSRQSQVTNPGTNGPAPEAFAKLTRKTGAVEVFSPAGENIAAEEGGDLPAGFTVRTVGDDSHAVVELLRDRTRVEIEPDSVVRFTGDAPETRGQPRMFLASGQLTAAVPERPDDRPLIVATSVTEILARGSTFVLSSAGPESARVDIKKGKVELVRAHAPKPVPVGVGSAVVRADTEKVDIQRTFALDRTPKRALAAPATRDATFSPDGTEVWVASTRQFARWSADGGLKEVSFYPRKGNEGGAAFSRDKRLLVSFRPGDESTLVRTVPDGGEHAAIKVRLNETRNWALAPNGAWLAVTEPKPHMKRVRVFDGATGDERFAREFEEVTAAIAAASDGETLAVGLNDPARGVNNKIVFLNAATGDRLFALSTQRRPLTALAFSADGRYLAAAFNGAVQVWDVRARELVRTITGFERALVCLAFAPDGTRLAAGTQDGHVWVWEPAGGRQTQLIETGGRAVRALSFSPNGKQLVTVANVTGVAVWDVTDVSPAVQ
jgi:ferric-dicitrate binding protein FerR (iron transport regulator)